MCGIDGRLDLADQRAEAITHHHDDVVSHECRVAKDLYERHQTDHRRTEPYAVEGMEPMRAVREFTAEPVHSGQIEAWMEAARRCGSSRNSQPWRFAVVRRPETLQVLA